MLTHPGRSGFRLMIVFMIAAGLGPFAPWPVRADPQGPSNTTRPIVTKAVAPRAVTLPDAAGMTRVDKNVMPAGDAT